MSSVACSKRRHGDARREEVWIRASRSRELPFQLGAAPSPHQPSQVGWSCPWRRVRRAQQVRGGGRSCSVDCPGLGALQASRAYLRSEAHRGHHVKPPIASGMVHTRSSTSAPAKPGLSGRHSHGLVVPLEKEPESTTEVGATCCAAWSLWDGESKIMPTAATAAAATYCGGGALGLSCLPAAAAALPLLSLLRSQLLLVAGHTVATSAAFGGLLELQQDLEFGGGGGGGGWCPCNGKSSQGFPVDTLMGWSASKASKATAIRSCSVLPLALAHGAAGPRLEAQVPVSC